MTRVRAKWVRVRVRAKCFDSLTRVRAKCFVRVRVRFAFAFRVSVSDMNRVGVRVSVNFPHFVTHSSRVKVSDATSNPDLTLTLTPT